MVQFRRTVIDILLKCINSLSNKKLRIYHEDIIVKWNKYQCSDISRLEYVKIVGLK